jgi:two-component system CheB/CheR fusion protein
VLVNGDGDILYISGRTGKYLEPAAGKVNINIHAMARDGLRDALCGSIRKALHHPAIHLDGLQVDNDGTPTPSTSPCRSSTSPMPCGAACWWCSPT